MKCKRREYEIIQFLKTKSRPDFNLLDYNHNKLTDLASNNDRFYNKKILKMFKNQVNNFNETDICTRL